MDRLVMPDVKELNLVFSKGQKCFTTFGLTNLMHTLPVAVFLDTTDPFLLSFTDPFSVIPPLGSVSFSVVSQPLDQPRVSGPAATVLVRSSMLLTWKSSQESLRRVFSESRPHIFKDATIPVYFVGRGVIDFLLLSPRSKTVNIPLILSKSLQFCNDSDLNLLLKSAVITGNTYFVTCLIKNGADVNVRDIDGKSMMSWAIGSGNVDVVRVMIESGFVVDRLVDRFLHDLASVNGVDTMEVLCRSYLDLNINSIDSLGRTPLHISAIHGYVEVLKFLITLGSDPNVVDDYGWSPLHYASSKGHVKVVEILLNSCTYVKYALTKKGKSAITLAYENDHIDLYDMLYLQDILHKSATKGDVNGLMKCLKEGVKVNGKDQNGWTALHRAAFKGRVKCVKVLLDSGACADLVDNNGFTALHRAMEAGHGQVARLLVAQGVRTRVKSLIDHMVVDLDCDKKKFNSCGSSLPKGCLKVTTIV